VRQFLASAHVAADIVFIDPPYELPDDELAADLAGLTLAPDAVVVVERSSRSPEPIWPATLELSRSKQYGDTTLWWAHTAE
jgi:16S rRNA (guanine966-N2)-methyltransferase